MCVSVTPKIEPLFQTIDDIFIQDLEEQYIEETGEYKQAEINIEIVVFVILLTAYIFFIQLSFIYINDNLNAFILIIHTLFYGMIITINQLHNKLTIHHLIFISYTSIVLPYDHLITLYTIPFTIEFIFNKNNSILTMLVNKYNIILGNNIFWMFITWLGFIRIASFIKYVINV